MVGRLLCDTYLSARELVREVDYTLTTLARSLLKQERSELAAADVPGQQGQGAVVFCVPRVRLCAPHLPHPPTL